MRNCKTDLCSDESEVAGESTGLGAALAPVEEALGVGGVARNAEGVDDAGGEDMLAEAVGSPLPVEGGQDEADGGEIVGAISGAAECVEKLAEFGALEGGGLALLHPVEEAHHHTKLRFRHLCASMESELAELLCFLSLMAPGFFSCSDLQGNQL